MRHLMIALFVALAFVGQSAWGGAFLPGDLVVYCVGNGTGSLVNTGNPVFLDEFTPSGTLVQSVPLPTAASGPNYPLIASGTATSEGFLTQSADGQYLLLTGYGTTIGGTASLSGTSATTVPRVVARVDSAGNINTTTALSDFANANNPRSAVSTDGTSIWVSGAAGGVRYTTLGSTTSTQLNSTIGNSVQVGIAGGQLYATTKTTGDYLAAIGSGLPTTGGQGLTAILATGGGTSPDAFFFADLSPSTPGLDTLYVADDGVGIEKYCLVGGVWTAEGSKGSASNAYRGLTGTVDGSGNVTLYTTRKGGSGASGGGELASIIDSSGFGNAMNGSFTLLATAPTDEAFRGVAFAPVAAAAPEPATLALLLAAAMCFFGWRYCRSRRSNA
jgi:hypothetical protein